MNAAARRPMEGFQLIDSKVETEMPETDLFPGVRA
ncbi:hypothetical protein J2Y42_003579 [Leifsonia sp. 1010]|nr:hypothetical protein [Leifsonia sp. 1010]